jgi:hypothetical protein
MVIDYILVFFAGYFLANVVRSDFEFHLVSHRSGFATETEASWNPVGRENHIESRDLDDEEEDPKID